VKDVSHRAEQAKVFGFLGPNGADDDPVARPSASDDEKVNRQRIGLHLAIGPRDGKREANRFAFFA
jgi:hypothetical protein